MKIIKQTFVEVDARWIHEDADVHLNFHLKDGEIDHIRSRGQYSSFSLTAKQFLALRRMMNMAYSAYKFQLEQAGSEKGEK